jgi:hypothetical protein
MEYFLLSSFIFLSLFNNAFSQQEKKSGGIAIKISPLTLVEPNFPLIQGSLEIQFKNNWSIQPEVGIKIPSLIPKPDSAFFNSYSGYRLRLEVRKYFFLSFLPYKTDRNIYCKPYLSASVMVSENKYNSGYLSDSTNRLNEFGVKKKQAGIDARCGIQLIFFHRLIVDGYLGIGIKKREIEDVQRMMYNDYQQPVDVNIHNISGDLSENSGFTLMLPVGIKIGYIITKNRFR